MAPGPLRRPISILDYGGVIIEGPAWKTPVVAIGSISGLFVTTNWAEFFFEAESDAREWLHLLASTQPTLADAIEGA